MPNILFPATARPHLARQKLLVDELRESSNVDVFQPKGIEGAGMSVSAIFYAIELNNYLNGKEFDCIIIRGDRYEMLGLAMVASYKGIPIVHIEGGDISGVIDNKVRGAITKLADYHFCTNDEAHSRLINMGVSPDRVWNFGSLDVEFALKVPPKRMYAEDYILVAYHPIEGEDESEIDKALLNFEDKFKIIRIGSNKDYGRGYGVEQYSPEEYINLMRYASVCIGNSSSFIKEASVLGVPVVNIGMRQKKRLKPHNVLEIACESERIRRSIGYQLVNTYEPDNMYYHPETSKKITQEIVKIFK